MIEQNVCVIGITGGSGSGKTSIIKSLKEFFDKKDVCIISQDDYYKERAAQETDENGIKNFDLPSSILADELAKDLQTIRSGQRFSRKEYTFNNEKVVSEMLHFDPAPIIIVEGLFVMHFPEVKEQFDVKVFVEASDVHKIIRRIKRDRIERNYPLEDVLYRYQRHVTPAYNAYILPYKKECDLIINNNKDYKIGLDFLRSYVLKKLENR